MTKSLPTNGGLRVGKVAQLLGVNAQTIRRMADAGQIICYRVGARQERRIPQSEVDRLLAAARGPAQRVNVLYARPDPPASPLSLLQQLRDWAATQPPPTSCIEIVDTGSGNDPTRGGLRRLLALVEQRLVHRVVMASLDQLATPDLLAHLLSFFQSYDVAVQVLSGGSLASAAQATTEAPPTPGGSHAPTDIP